MSQPLAEFGEIRLRVVAAATCFMEYHWRAGAAVADTVWASARCVTYLAPAQTQYADTCRNLEPAQVKNIRHYVCAQADFRPGVKHLSAHLAVKAASANGAVYHAARQDTSPSLLPPLPVLSRLVLLSAFSQEFVRAPKPAPSQRELRSANLEPSEVFRRWEELGVRLNAVSPVSHISIL